MQLQFFFFFSDSNKLSFHFFQVDGEFTLNENVCDVDGLNVAAEAFSDLREASANDLVHLPNNPYTPQQLFFINTAQVRSKLHPDVRNLVQNGPNFNFSQFCTQKFGTV